MKSLAIFLFLFTIQAKAFQCPDGWQQMPGESLCLYPVIAPGFYVDTVRTCQALNAIPVKIQNIFENSFAFAIIEELNGLTPYIGVEKKIDGTWVYSDGTPLIYSNWDKGQPKNGTKLHCVTLNLASGKWIADDCSLARPSACSFIGGNDTTSTPRPSPTPSQSSGSCLENWFYNPSTNYCYFLQNFTYSDGVHWALYDFPTAENLCQQMGSHLVSIHSDTENNFISNLVYSNAANQREAAPTDHGPCWYQYAWIGYSGFGNIGTGNWTDGSPVDYLQAATIDRVAYFQISNDTSCGAVGWAWENGPGQIARFVCKKPSRG